MRQLNTTFLQTSDIYTADALLQIGTGAATVYDLGAKPIRLALAVKLVCDAAATVTVGMKAYGGPSHKATLFTAEMNSGITNTDRYYFNDNIFVPYFASWCASIKVYVRSNTDTDTSRSIYFYLYDVDKDLDVLTIAGSTPTTASDVADLILENPSYPIVTNPDGSVKTKGGLAR